MYVHVTFNIMRVETIPDGVLVRNSAFTSGKSSTGRLRII